MKKTLFTLVIGAFLIVGCSHHQELKPTSSRDTGTQRKSEENFAILLQFNKAVDFQNSREYAKAISIYDTIINYYSAREDKGILSSAYINKFECSLLINRGYRKSDIEDFLRRFGQDPKQMMAFEVLYILDSAKTKSMDSEVERWSSKYRNQRLEDWTFKYIDNWVQRIENVNARNRVKRYVSIFKHSL